MELTIGIINNDRAMKNDIHIGDQIRKKISEQGLTITEFAKRINRSREAVRGILQKKSINTELLSTISVAFAFFALIVACTNAPERSRYSEEQINSLALDSTIVLTPDNRSVEIVDANSFLKPQEFNLEELIKEIKVVPLETTDVLDLYASKIRKFTMMIYFLKMYLNFQILRAFGNKKDS